VSFRGTKLVVGCDAPGCPARLDVFFPAKPDGTHHSARVIATGTMTEIFAAGWDFDVGGHYCNLHRRDGTLRPSPAPAQPTRAKT